MMPELGTLNVNLDAKNLENSLKKGGDAFGERIKKSLESATSKLGLGSFKPISSGGGKEKGVSGIGIGVAAGLAAGGVTAGISFIADAIKDFPLVVAIMKLLKAILVLLFWPLIPIFKIALEALKLIWDFLKKLKPSGEGKGGETAFGAVGAVGGGIVGAILGGPIGAAIGAVLGGLLSMLFIKTAEWMSGVIGALASFIWGIVKPAWEWMLSVGTWLWEQIIVPAFNGLVGIGKWIWDNIVVPQFEIVGMFGIWIWNTFLQPAFQAIKDVGMWIWNQILKPTFMWLWDMGSWIWNQIIKPVWDTLAGYLNGIWDNILKPAWQAVADAIKGAWEWLKSLFNVGKAAVESVSKGIGKAYTAAKSTVKPVRDFVVTPNGTLQTDPNDYIIGTKNPKGLGKGMTVNINIDKPMLTGQADIKNLVKAIELELYKANRRYNSYV